jgi:hypothetical protein
MSGASCTKLVRGSGSRPLAKITEKNFTAHTRAVGQVKESAAPGTNPIQ